MSKHIPLYLTPEQRGELETLIKSGNAPARVQTRARILLLSDRSQGNFRTDAQIAEVPLCTAGTVRCIGKPSASYVAKMEDVLDVYQRPYDPKRPVVCVDEGGKELRDTPHGLLPMQPGQPT